MSSTGSTMEVQAVKLLTGHGDKTQRLVRTTSLEKIRRFNSFICSQQYYILPALLAWLRSSQSVLHSSTEKTIFVFRSLIFNAVIYKLYKLDYKAIVTQARLLVESANVLRTVFYLVGLILFSQLVLCFYLLAHTYVPSGLVFLIVCLFYINYLNYRAQFYYMENRVLFKKDN